jgi:hypothetical protein
MGDQSSLVLETRAVPLQEIAQLFDEFVELLERNGISPLPGSELEHWLLYPDTWKRLASASSPAAGEPPVLDEVRRDLRGVLGIAEIARHALAVSRSAASLSSMLGHLRLLTAARSPAQNVRSTSDEDGNKTFELLLALLATRAGAANVELENATRTPKGVRNPDVLLTWEERRRGIACKVLDSADPRAFIRNLEAGLRQLQASPAQSGCVCLNLKNIIPEDLAMPIGTDGDGNLGFFVHDTLDLGRARIREWLAGYLDSVSAALTPEFWDRFEDPRLEPEVELYVFDVCLVAGDITPRLNTMKFFSSVPVGDRQCTPGHTRFMEAMNAAPGKA